MKVKKMYIQNNSIFLLTESGFLYTWGDNKNGILGRTDVEIDDYTSSPGLVEVPEGIKEIKFLYGCVFVMTYTGKLFSWGLNRSHRLANENILINSISTKPSIIKIHEPVVSFYAYSHHYQWKKGEHHLKIGHSYWDSCYAITESGNLYVWGENELGVIGINEENTYKPTCILKDISELRCNFKALYAKTLDGQYYSWGYNYNNQLYRNNRNDLFLQTPEIIKNGENIFDFVIDDRHFYQQPQLNIKSFVLKNSEIEVEKEIPDTVIQWACNEMLYYALTDKGDIYNWGSEVVIHTDKDFHTKSTDNPTKILGVSNINKIGCYYDDDFYWNYVFAQDKDNNLYVWEAKHPIEVSDPLPSQVKNINKKIKKIEYEGEYHCVLTIDGNIYIINDNNMAVKIPGVNEKVIDFYSSIYAIFIITENNLIYSLGKNKKGQLGHEHMPLDELMTEAKEINQSFFK